LGSGDRPSSKFGRFENRPGLYPRRLSSQQQCLLWGSVSLDPLRAVRVVTPPRLLLPWALNLGGFGSTAAAHCQPAVSHPPRACETHSGLPLSKGIHFDLICVSRSIFLLEPPECCIGCSMGLSFRFSRAAFERITPSDQPPSPALWRNIVHEYPYLRHLCFSGISIPAMTVTRQAAWVVRGAVRWRTGGAPEPSSELASCRLSSAPRDSISAAGTRNTRAGSVKRRLCSPGARRIASTRARATSA